MAIITVGAEKGGVAKTKLATNLAAKAATSGAEVLLLDTDIQGSSISWAAIRSGANISPEITALSLPENPTTQLASLSNKYDLIVVDIGAQNYKTMLQCAYLSDLVLVPCGADQQEVESTLNVFDTLKRNGDKHKDGSGVIPAHVVLTRVSTAVNSKNIVELRDLFSKFEISVFDACLPSRTAWPQTGKTGKGVHELTGKDRSQKAVEEMEALFEEVKRRIVGGN